MKIQGRECFVEIFEDPQLCFPDQITGEASEPFQADGLIPFRLQLH